MLIQISTHMHVHKYAYARMHTHAELTPAGVEQAKTLQQGDAGRVGSSIELVVASSLTRAIQTADLVFPSQLCACPRVSLDVWREVSGLLVNAKRRTRTELQDTHKSWNFDHLENEEDVLWTPEALESQTACAHRAYLALKWAWQRPEEHIGIVAHGGTHLNQLSQYNTSSHARTLGHGSQAVRYAHTPSCISSHASPLIFTLFSSV